MRSRETFHGLNGIQLLPDLLAAAAVVPLARDPLVRRQAHDRENVANASCIEGKEQSRRRIDRYIADGFALSLSLIRYLLNKTMDRKFPSLSYCLFSGLKLTAVVHLIVADSFLHEE